MQFEATPIQSETRPSLSSDISRAPSDNHQRTPKQKQFLPSRKSSPLLQFRSDCRMLNSISMLKAAGSLSYRQNGYPADGRLFPRSVRNAEGPSHLMQRKRPRTFCQRAGSIVTKDESTSGPHPSPHGSWIGELASSGSAQEYRLSASSVIGGSSHEIY